MSEFISGDEAKLAWAKGEKVQWRQSFDWNDLGAMNILGIFDDEDIEFRLEPRTITINGIEVPAPFEPKEGEEYFLICPDKIFGYGLNVQKERPYKSYGTQFGAWRTEEEIKQVVAALRSIFNPK